MTQTATPKTTKQRSLPRGSSRQGPQRQGSQRQGSPRERLLAAADELFYAEGVQTVGIDRIIDYAGVAKASLYSLFGSKEALVRAYLDTRHDRITGRLLDSVNMQTDPQARILAVFDAQAEMFATPGFRGCAFVSASTEAPEGGLIEEASSRYRTWMRNLFFELAKEAGAPDPAALAAELQIVYDGAGLSARMDKDPAIARASRRAAETLLQRELPKPA